MIRWWGRKRRIAQHSKNLVAQLSPSLCAAMLCHIKARRSSRWDSVVSEERGVMREGEEVVQQREEEKKMADRRSRWTRGQSEEKATWTYEKSQNRRVPSGFPRLKKRGGKGAQRSSRRCNVKSFLPLLSPTPPHPKVTQFAETIQTMWLHRIQLAAAAEALSHADSAVLWRAHHRGGAAGIKQGFWRRN